MEAAAAKGHRLRREAPGIPLCGNAGRKPLEVALNEQPDELLERHGRPPCEPLACLGGVADEVVEFGLPPLERAVYVHVLAGVEPDSLESDRDDSVTLCVSPIAIT